MSDELMTSPLLFGYRGRDGRMAAFDGQTGRRFRLASERAAQIAAAFLEPRPPADAGFADAELEEALEAGLLVSADADCGRTAWEGNGWSRAAFLLFSQMDLPYVESARAENGSRALTGIRRSTVEGYLAEGDYPEPGPVARGEAVELPDPPEAVPTLSEITSRRSVRGFSDRPPGAVQMAGVLHGATAAFRTFAEDRGDGDPFRLLNSFYSWAHLFVVVQGVQDVERAIYEYDWRHHRLVRTSDPPGDDELAACVQGQRWALGTGFAVFVVADLRGYAWIYRHSRAYLHVLTQVGELGQELLMAASALGLGGWITPAVHESRTSRLLGLDGTDGLEPLAMVKLGLPRR